MAMDLETMEKFLLQNAVRGQWGEVIAMYSTDKTAHSVATLLGDTALHIAVSNVQQTAVEQLVQIISVDRSHYKQLLQMENDRNFTPLHIAAIRGSVKMCYDIASVDPSLVSYRNKNGETPLYSAAFHGNKDAFLCLHSLCSSDPDQLYLNCRTSEDGQTILHTAIMGDYLDLAFHITNLYPELAYSVDMYGKLPLHFLAHKPLAFKSGCRFIGWKKIIYKFLEGISADQFKFEPNTYLRALTKETLASQNTSWLNKNPSPENYRRCINFFDPLWKGIQVVISSAATITRKADEGKARDNTDPEDGTSTNSQPQGFEFFPKIYRTCVNFFKFLSKAILVIGVVMHGFDEMKKIKDEMENHNWSLKIMDRLLELASSYNYEDDGSTPLSTVLSKYEETKPYDFDFGDGSITFAVRNLNMLDKNNEEGKGQEMIRKPVQETPVLLAAKNGVVEMVEQILNLFPNAIYDTDMDKKNVVLLAAENRQSHIYQLLLRKDIYIESVFQTVDSEDNSALHLAAKLKDHKPWLITGDALQLQWELRWYQFVRKSVPRNFFLTHNNEGETAEAIFINTHKDLARSSGQWLINTCQSGSTVAALIATVAFATSATIPGGNDPNGNPILKNQLIFEIFAITSAIALCCSLTSVVIFLSILSSRFQQNDIGVGVPRKFIVSLSLLFVSLAAMLVSFCAGHFFLLKDKLHYTAFAVYLIPCLPLTWFAITQFPSYFNIVWATLTKVPQGNYVKPHWTRLDL